MLSNEGVIGLIPCGGYATRISPLPCSKELFPVGIRQVTDSCRPKVVSHYLLERMRYAGITKAYMILRPGKWDIPEYYRDGKVADMNLGYLVLGLPYGPPYTLDQAYPFVRGAKVAIGFPDILFGPRDMFSKALDRLASTQADIVLGLCSVDDPTVSDMVDVDRNGFVRQLQLKPTRTRLKLGWVMAVWTSAFTEFLHEYLSVPRTSAQVAGENLPPELTVGHVVKAAVEAGLRAQSVNFRGSRYLDIGTPAGLARLFPQRAGELTA